MNTTDPIADMLTRIRNANAQRHSTVDVPYSKVKKAIADILVSEGFVASQEIIEDGNFKTIRLTLKYEGKTRVLQGLKRISKPGLRNICKCRRITKSIKWFRNSNNIYF